MNLLSINIREVNGGAKASWIKELRIASKVSILAVQETKVESLSSFVCASYWGNKNFVSACAELVGLFGGLAWIWDPRVLKIESVVHNRFYLIIKGSVVGNGDPINLVNVYAPQSTATKLHLWNELSGIIDSSVWQWVLAGEFNAVRNPDERKHFNFKPACANNFNNFIFSNGLIEYPMQGRRFTCIRDNGKKLSKLDRFLVCSEFFNRWSSACVRVMPSRFSDHCLIILEVVDLKFGPRPFRVYNSCVGKPGFEEAVKEALVGFESFEPPDGCLTAKFARIRSSLKKWRDDFIANENELERTALAEMELLESKMENRDLSEEEEWSMAENKKLIKEVEIRKNLDLKQRGG
ncbi:putative Endonuclease/exonuclease/phosphatase superfamily [Helianthus annuus]|nr:putative Endonuclease/exonuclease/phosphatase superfamily [Helianthus annuus]